MADPVIDAAQRALGLTTDGMNQASRGRVARTAAREALKPIRELHQELCTGALDEDAEVEHGMRLVLDALAPLVYSTEDLMGGAR
ncbi:hypothetical protein [Mycobacterium sp. DL440]|uniref:hypothetical protein n=1 Tax=Mycobacterium sp. DL440 TaxID=2675523 RepID=UPI001FB913BE|nr:hypothetical protein [Mycobacterium sp. DL440]